MILSAKEAQPASVDFLLTANACLVAKDGKPGLMVAAVKENNVEVVQAIIAHDR